VLLIIRLVLILILILTAFLVRPLQEGHGCITSKMTVSEDGATATVGLSCERRISVSVKDFPVSYRPDTLPVTQTNSVRALKGNKKRMQCYFKFTV